MGAKAIVGVKQRARVNGHKPQSARRDATDWSRIIEAQRRSPLTMVEFCRRRRILG